MYKNSLTDLASLSDEEIKEVLNSIDTILTDCDGVIWLENEPIEGAAEVINRLQELGKRVIFVTNNSTKIRDEFVTKSRRLGFNINSDQIMSTAYLAVDYLASLGYPKDKKVFVVGSKGIGKELDNAGYKHFGIGPDNIDCNLIQTIHSFQIDPDVGAVIVGFDEHFSYTKMMKAASYLENENCIFIGTNSDERFPMKIDLVIPGTGAILRAVETVAERKATIVGKPHSYIAEALKRTFNVDPARTLMIGDRLNTDIWLGIRCEFQTLFVLSGVHTLEDVEDFKTDDEGNLAVPDFYLDKLGSLLPYLN